MEEKYQPYNKKQALRKASRKGWLLTLLMLGVTPLAYSAKHPTPVLEAIAQAGSNKAQLTALLDGYAKNSKDSLKYRAACFLIENMPIHNTRSYHWEDSLKRTVPYNEFDYPNFKTAVDTFNKIALKGKLQPVVEIKTDISTMSAQELQQNIEQAFEQWGKPWARALNFELFCEYLLPYRIMDEPHQPFRKLFEQTYQQVAEPHKQKSILEFCAAMCQNLKGTFYNTYVANAANQEPAFLSPRQILFRRQGACEDMANWGAYLFRSMGIATTVDYTPAWATSTGSHYWNVTFGEHTQTIPFVMESTDSPGRFYLHREPSKVLRITYSKQHDALAARLPKEEIPEGFMQRTNYKDVTSTYWMVADLSVALDTMAAKRKVAYVAVLNGLSWKTVWWGDVKNAQATFRDMSCGVVYLPMSYHKGVLTPAEDPYLLRNNGKTEILKPNLRSPQRITLPEKENYLLYRVGKKYTLYCWYQRQWRRVGEKTATDSSPLVFDNVPENALLLLIPEYTAGKERPFTINKEGVREYW